MLSGIEVREHVFSVMVGMARRAVPAREVAGGTNVRATLACEGVAPLNAARTSQRDVPTRLNTYEGEGWGEGGCQHILHSPFNSAIQLPSQSCKMPCE